MVPVFLALLGVVIAAMVRERHVLERYLTHEVAVGVLGPAEVAEIASPRARRRALRAASAHGVATRRARRELHHAAIELAFLRRHRARRPGSAEPHRPSSRRTTWRACASSATRRTRRRSRSAR